MYIVNKKFGLITNEKNCKIVDYESLGKEMKNDSDISEVGHLYKKGDDFLLDVFCQNVLDKLINDGYISKL